MPNHMVQTMNKAKVTLKVRQFKCPVRGFDGEIDGKKLKALPAWVKPLDGQYLQVPWHPHLKTNIAPKKTVAIEFWQLFGFHVSSSGIPLLVGDFNP